LHAALKLAVEACISREWAKERLIEFLKQADPTDWRYKHAKQLSSEKAIADFWRLKPEVNWQDSSAYLIELHETEPTFVRSTSLYGIEIARRKLIGALGLKAKPRRRKRRATPELAAIATEPALAGVQATAPQTSAPAIKTRGVSAQRKAVAMVARELFPPDGKPRKWLFSTKAAVRSVRKELKKRGIRAPSKLTIERAIGRHK
jgi:hypothetical protein